MGHNPLVDEEELEKEMRKDAPSGRFREFDCPNCNANNPSDEFGNNAELLCNYCGSSFKAKVSEEGKLKLREV